MAIHRSLYLHKISSFCQFHSLELFRTVYFSCQLESYISINNGNRTEWSPTQSVIVRVINAKSADDYIDRVPLPALLQTKLDERSFLLPINHNYTETL